MKKIKIITIFIFLMLMISCAPDRFRDDVSEDIINIEDNISENQTDCLGEDPQEDQSEKQTDDIQGDRINDSFDIQAEEIVCENPYFFPSNTSFLTAEMIYIRIGEAGTIVELSLHWLKQYDNGCLAKLAIVPFDGMPDYMDEERLNTYFYVTDSEIYRIPPSIVQGGEPITFYNNDAMIVSILDTDEKLVEHGELICCLEEQMGENESGTHITVGGQSNQIVCNVVDAKGNGDINYYENYIWEKGVGLVGYKSGCGTESGEDTDIIYLKDIMYGTTNQKADEDIVCTNPYFFPQTVSLMTADLTYEDYEYAGFTTISNELELHWLKQYENGCLVRLSVVPFDAIQDYMDMRYFNFYFYVTPDKIYSIYFFVSSEYFNAFYEGSIADSEKNYYYHTLYGSAGRLFEHMDVYIEHNDDLIMSVLNTDERLIKYGELIFSLEEICNVVGEEEAGIELSISQEGDQVIYSRANAAPYHHYFEWENYCWRKGVGLAEYRKGRGAEAEPFYITNIAVE